MQIDYKPPAVQVGDRVLVDADPAWTQPTLGMVFAVTGNCPSVVYYVGGQAYFRNECLHKDDPNCARLSQRFDPSFGGECASELETSV